MSESEHEYPPDAEHQVTPLELFFDLTFVFAMTQVTTLLAEDRRGVGSSAGCSSSPRSCGDGASMRG